MFRALQPFAIPAVLSCLLTSCSSTPSSPQNLKAGSTQVVLPDETNAGETLITTIPGRHASISELVRNLLVNARYAGDSRATQYFDRPPGWEGRSKETGVKSLAHYFQGARIVDKGAGVVLSFSSKALAYFDRSLFAWMVTGAPIADTIRLNYPSISKFYWEFDGQVRDAEDWGA